MTRSVLGTLQKVDPYLDVISHGCAIVLGVIFLTNAVWEWRPMLLKYPRVVSLLAGFFLTSTAWSAFKYSYREHFAHTRVGVADD